MLPLPDEVELCHAQYCVPKPEALLLCAVAITYCTDAFELEFELPKCPAALIASFPSCVWVGCDGAAELLSCQTLARIPLGFPACPVEPHVELPLAMPWQYCVTLFSHELAPAWFRKFWTIADSPDGSMPHCEPQRTR